MIWLLWLVKVLKFSTLWSCYLGIGKIHDKLIRIGVAHLTSMSTKQFDIRIFFVSRERSLHDLNYTLRCAIFVIQAFEFDFISKNIEFSSLLFSFEHFILGIDIFTPFLARFTPFRRSDCRVTEALYMRLFISRARCIQTVDPPRPIQGPQWS